MSSTANGFTEPLAARDHFARQFNLADPEAARDSYQRCVLVKRADSSRELIKS